MSFPQGAELAEALRRVVGGDVRFDSYTRHLFSRDASMYTIEPIGVVFPRDSADVAAVVSTAAEFGVPVLPRGAGTSLAGQTVGQAIVMDLSRHMNKIIEVDAEQRMARVQPGVVQEQLNLAGARHGLLFGPDTSTKNRATLGGMIGNNSAGSQSVRYGMTIDHVLALDVVLSDASQATFGPLTAGELVSRAAAPTLDGRICRELPRLVERHREAIAIGFPRFWRQSGGYRLDRLTRSTGLDLAKFVVGSEGTLVTVVEATVRLVPAPRYRVIAVGHFTSVQAAIEATEDALACQPAAVELLDRTIIELSRRKIEYASLGSILHGDPEALLFVTFFGDTMAEAVAGLDRLDEGWQAHRHGYHTLRAVHAAEQAALLKVREAGLGLLMAASTGTRRPLAFVEDTAVEPAKLASYTARFRQILDSRGLTAGFYGHCSVGCLHIRPFVDLSAPGQPEVMRAVAEEVRDLVRQYGGVNSSEHGDGLARSEFNRDFFGDKLYAAMQETKRLFDPQNRMSPGKIADAPAMTDLPRDAARPVRLELATLLRFDAPGGMHGAARPLPRFQRQDLRRWFRRRPDPETPARPGSAGELIFLADSFTTFTEPAVGRSAIELLELAGWQVRFEDAGCCGRASLSKGLVDQARRMAAAMADRLGEAAARGVPIVGVEPSCLLTLRDEYLALLPGDPRAQAVAAATRLPEELLVEAIAEGRLVLPRENRGRRIVFHGHCHQKALAGTAATMALLRSIPGAEVVEVDAGCCGMAGSFGFEAEHYDLSMSIGELRLFPAVRAEAPETIIAATGVSCRQQIAHGTGRPARHPLEIVREVLLASSATG